MLDVPGSYPQLRSYQVRYVATLLQTDRTMLRLYTAMREESCWAWHSTAYMKELFCDASPKRMGAWMVQRRRENPKAIATETRGATRAHRVWRRHNIQLSKRLTQAQRETYLLETNSSRLLTEALTAEVKAVLADDTRLVGAEAAGRQELVHLFSTPNISA